MIIFFVCSVLRAKNCTSRKTLIKRKKTIITTRQNVRLFPRNKRIKMYNKVIFLIILRKVYYTYSITYLEAYTMIKKYVPSTSYVELTLKQKKPKKVLRVYILYTYKFIAQEVRKSRKHKNKQEMSARGRGQNEKNM